MHSFSLSLETQVYGQNGKYLEFIIGLVGRVFANGPGD